MTDLPPLSASELDKLERQLHIEVYPLGTISRLCAMARRSLAAQEAGPVEIGEAEIERICRQVTSSDPDAVVIRYPEEGGERGKRYGNEIRRWELNEPLVRAILSALPSPPNPDAPASKDGE